MPRTQIQANAIHSSLAADPELAELIQQFVSELPSRMAWLERHFEADDHEALRRAVHQLKGAAGSFGFHRLTPYALRVESLLTRGRPRDEVGAALSELLVRCRRVTAVPAG